MHTHNATTDSIRAAYLAKLQSRPVIDPHDLQTARTITCNSVDWLREAYRLLKARPDLSDHIQRAAAALKVLQQRLDEEGAK